MLFLYIASLSDNFEAIPHRHPIMEIYLLSAADPDHADGLDTDQKNHFTNAEIYLGKIEENYLTNVYHRSTSF
jgi:hypothetical protein